MNYTKNTDLKMVELEGLWNSLACIFEVDKAGFDEKVITVLADEIDKKL